MQKAAFLAQILGLVQGVGYRFFALRRANEYGITGYVKNLVDGSVEVFAEGDREILEQFLRELWNGPAWSQVQDVKIKWLEFSGRYHDFRIEY